MSRKRRNRKNWTLKTERKYKMNILEGFKKILNILTDYPGIEDIINLKEANHLIDGLIELPEENIRTLSEKPQTGKLNQVIEAIENRWQNWREALEKLDFFFFDIDELDDKDIILWGSITLSSDPDVVIYLRFLVNNKAELSTDETSEKLTTDFSGTWSEVYNKAVEIKNNFIPEPPRN